MFVNSIIGVGLIVLLLFPVIYAFYFKLHRKILFLASCYGLEQIITMLLFGLVSPLIILKIFTFPQLEVNESLGNVKWLLAGMQFVENYWYWGTLILLLIVPFMVHRRYKDVFVTHTNT